MRCHQWIQTACDFISCASAHMLIAQGSLSNTRKSRKTFLLHMYFVLKFYVTTITIIYTYDVHGRFLAAVGCLSVFSSTSRAYSI